MEGEVEMADSAPVYDRTELRVFAPSLLNFSVMGF